MIIDTSQGAIEVIGDIKEFKTSIDPKNLEFITTLLSSNLYSDPEQSFIREIVSNAWDSHVEAGTTDTPVIVKFGNNDYTKSITIRDYGTGLSPERFAEVYCNIGSSTKRESNNYIGGFGIGKYSSLACSNTVYITSYYNGMAYYYVMVKSGNSITTNLFKELPTTEKNGVEITIKNITSFYSYKKALDYIVFFPNVYVDGIDHYLNDVKIKKLTNIAVASKHMPYKLLLGNVLYPCNKELLPSDVADFLRDIYGTGIVIKFEIGELGITPNRESVIYTSDTIDKISSRIRDAKKELLSLAEKHLCKDYQNLEEYCDALVNDLYYDPITDSINTYYNGYNIRKNDKENMGITYKNKDIKDFLNILRSIYATILPNYKAVICDDKIYTTKLPYKIHNKDLIKTEKIISCKQSTRLTASIKEFLKRDYNKYTIIGELNKSILENHLSSDIQNAFTSENCSYKDFIINGVYESILAKTKIIDFDTDPDYLKFKADIKSNKIVPTNKINDIALYKYEWPYSFRITMQFKTLQESLAYLKTLKQGIILANMDEDVNFWTSVAEVKGFSFFKARKDIVSAIRELNLSYIVDMGWLLREDPLLNKIYTIQQYFPTGIDVGIVNELHYTLQKNISDEFKSLLKHSNVNAIYGKHCSVVGTIDPYIKYLCIELRHYMDKWKGAKLIVESNKYGCYNGTLIAAVIMKTSSYRINAKAYNEIKNNSLLKILCKK